MLDKLPGFGTLSNKPFLTESLCSVLRESWQTLLEVHDDSLANIGLGIYTVTKFYIYIYIYVF